MGARKLIMMGITTNIRTAVQNDIPHLMCLADIEYNLFEQKTPFDPEICERYIRSTMLDPEAIFIIIEDQSRIPFGFLTGHIDYVDLSTAPTAVALHWFVNNPNAMYGHKNYGLSLISAFEGWAKLKHCKKTMIGIRMNPGQRRSYDKTFDKIKYKPNYVYYTKDMT
tara:strand:+ start:2755 stop:3255 length:501 start_codon:yes stop_codon:yes gene_type:complete